MRPVTIADRKLFEEKLALMSSQSCECTFANIFMYSKPYGIEFIEVEGRLVVYERVARAMHYPIGEWTGPELLHNRSN